MAPTVFMMKRSILTERISGWGFHFSRKYGLTPWSFFSYKICLTRMPVVDRNNPQEVIGMISPADLRQARTRDLEEERRRGTRAKVRASVRFAKTQKSRKATRSLESCSPSCVFHEKESSFGFGRDEGGSLAGNESAIVLSSIFSRFACGSPGSTIRSSGSLRWTLTMFEGRFSREALLRLIFNGNPVCSAFFRR